MEGEAGGFRARQEASSPCAILARPTTMQKGMIERRMASRARRLQ